ncbi:MAG TPA: ATP-binding protein [Solirubrobacteraceae bacterium]|jgi:signal transduction histidine kinase
MVVVLGAAAMVVYVRQRVELDDAINHAIAARADDVATLVRPDGRGLAGSPRGGRLSESEEGFVQILTPAGRLVDGTHPVRRPALHPDEALRATRAPTRIERAIPGIEGRARMLARPVPVDGGTLVVVAGASLHDRDDALAGLVKSFLIGGAAAVLLASAIGYALAATGLAPVEAMTRRAKRISLGRGDERLPLPDAHDEIRRLGETLNEMLGRLEASLERERRFLADASHELRTPLAVVKVELEAAMRTAGDDPVVRESLHSALEETDHLAHLAEDLLLIARADDGRLAVQRENVPIRELLERTRDRFADRAGEQGRAIQVDVAADLRAPIDPLRGRQALGNLVENALRHGVGDIGLSAHRDGDAVEIDVSDEGPGFSRELAPRAFERFARDHGARPRPAAGLGLAIVRAIAEAHGGTATIVSAPSRGATVRLRMPLRMPLAEEH